MNCSSSSSSESFPVVIDLGNGQPAEDLLPTDLIVPALQAVFPTNSLETTSRPSASSSASWLQYCDESGDPSMLAELADFLHRFYCIHPSIASLPQWTFDTNGFFMSSGVSSGTDLVCQVLTHEGDSILVDDPCYFLMLPLFRQKKLRCIPVPLLSASASSSGVSSSESTIDFNRLESILQKNVIKFYYLIPTYQNPSGMTLTLQSRLKLLELSQKYGFYLVVDEVYHMLTFNPQKQPIPFALLNLLSSSASISSNPSSSSSAVGVILPPSNVISLSSFTKIFSPGLRVGWIHCSPSLVSQLNSLGVILSGGITSHFASCIVFSLLKTRQIDEYRKKLIEKYEKREKVVRKAFEEEFGTNEEEKGIKLLENGGGYFLWIHMKGVKNVEEWMKFSKKNHGVNVKPGKLFTVQTDNEYENENENKERYAEWIRVCFVKYKEEHLKEAVKRLKRSYDQWIKSNAEADTTNNNTTSSTNSKQIASNNST